MGGGDLRFRAAKRRTTHIPISASIHGILCCVAVRHLPSIRFCRFDGSVRKRLLITAAHAKRRPGFSPPDSRRPQLLKSQYPALAGGQSQRAPMAYNRNSAIPFTSLISCPAEPNFLPKPTRNDGARAKGVHKSSTPGALAIFARPIYMKSFS